MSFNNGKRKHRTGFKRFKRPDLVVDIAKNSGPARFYGKVVRDIEADLSGGADLSRIESELIRCFAGAATRIQYLNHQIMMCDVSEVPISDYANLASTMLRIGSRLGFRRRAKDVTPSLKDIVGEYEDVVTLDDVDSSDEETT
jgi:hypothetical protein